MYKKQAQQQFGQWIFTIREQQEKKRSHFAQSIGYKNINKGCRLILRWEQGKEDPAPQYHDAIQKFLDTTSRIVISSGGLKPVLDGFGGEYSIFANEFVQALENTDDPFTASGLYQKLRDSVTQKSLALGMEQVPLMSNLIAEGHEGPDFVLLPN